MKLLRIRGYDAFGGAIATDRGERNGTFRYLRLRQFLDAE